jgi:hypothetical protein
LDVTEKRLLAVDADLLKKIDESRGEMGRSEFINLLYESQLNADGPATAADLPYVKRAEFNELSAGIRELMRNFLEFALSYGLEMGKQPQGDGSFAEIASKLKSLSQQES